MIPLLVAIVLLLAGFNVLAYQGRRRVVVTTTAGDSFRGRRLPYSLRSVVLTDVELLQDHNVRSQAQDAAQTVDLNGRVEIPRRNVAIVQVLAE